MTWRIVCCVDSDAVVILEVFSNAVVILEVFSKKTRTTPDTVVERCRTRLANYRQSRK